MSLRIIRLGSPRHPEEGLRIGTVRRPPRGVKKEAYKKRDYFDVWLPELAPSAPLVKYALSQPLTPGRWARYARRYRSEMKKPSAARLLAMLAALSEQTNFSVGCYCEDETKCHRSLLKGLLIERGARMS
ncbi:MAG TPA: DUF488 family protein [Candidatus Binatia bacterium]